MISKIKNVVKTLFLFPFLMTIYLFILIDLIKRYRLNPIPIGGKEYIEDFINTLPIGLEWMTSSLFWVLILTIILN